MESPHWFLSLFPFGHRGRTTNRFFFSYETFVLPGVVTLQVKLLSYPQHRASICTMAFWDGRSSLVLGMVLSGSSVVISKR